LGRRVPHQRVVGGARHIDRPSNRVHGASSGRLRSPGPEKA
jgi:hypothetical protein